MNLSSHFFRVLTRSLGASCIGLACATAPLGATAQSALNYSVIEQKLKQALYSEALSLTDQELARQPHDPKLLFWKALALEKTGRPKEALSGYKALTQNHPELPEPHNNLGVLLMRDGDMEGAQMAFQEALRMNAQYGEAMENLADVLLIQSRRLYEKALQASTRKDRLALKIKALPSFPLETQP
mgnify:FL=1